MFAFPSETLSSVLSITNSQPHSKTPKSATPQARPPPHFELPPLIGMEFEPGHTTFSFPRRPCKPDRSISWTGSTKSTYSDMLGDLPSQYSLTDLDCNNRFYNQTMDFLDVPSMFEDALRQLASSPCFTYPPSSPQIGSHLAPTNATPMQVELHHPVGLEIDSNDLSVGDEFLWKSAIASAETEQDLPSNFWPVSPTDNHIISGSPLDTRKEILDSEYDVPGLQNGQTDQSMCSFSLLSPVNFQARTGLGTIDEEVVGSVGAVMYQEENHNYSESSMDPMLYLNQNLPANSPDNLVGQDYGHPHTAEAMLWQPLEQASHGEGFTHSPTTLDSPIEEAPLILVKIDLETHLDTQGPISAPPPLNELLSKFESNPGSLLLKRTRKRYSEIGKTKVKQVRKSGACVFCKARKVPCTIKGACNACVKLASRTPLVDHICVRTKLRDTFVGVRALHGTSFDNRKARLAPLLSSLTGRPRPIQLSVETYEDHDSVPFRNNDHHIRTLASLDIQVMQCSSSSLCRWKKLTKVSGIYVTADVFNGQRYVILPTSLPSIDEFDKFGRRILLASDGGHSGRITLILDRFLMIYCSRMRITEVRRIANLTARIASLNNLVAYGFLNLRDGSYDLLEQLPHGNQSQRYVSETVHDQVRLLAAEGLEPAEKIVFNELDNISKHVCGNEHARMIIGICILRLMLLYRDRLVRDNIRLGLKRPKKWHQYRLEKASFMYRRLTVAYGTLCREYDTPLTMEWEDEKHFGLDEVQSTLKDVYLQLQPAFRELCNERLSLQYDDVLKILLADPTKQQKTKKRRKTAH